MKRSALLTAILSFVILGIVNSTSGFAADQAPTFTKIEDRYQLMGVILDQSKNKNAIGIAVIQDKTNSKTAILKKGDKFPLESFGKTYYVQDVIRDKIILTDFQEEIILRHPNGRNIPNNTLGSAMNTLATNPDNDSDQDQFIDHEFINNYWEAQAALINGEDIDESEEENADQLHLPQKTEIPARSIFTDATEKNSDIRSTALPDDVTDFADDQRSELLLDEENSENSNGALVSKNLIQESDEEQ